MSDFESLARKVLELQNYSIGLTAENYDPTPMIVQMTQKIGLKKTITVERRIAKDTILIWSHPVQGVWGSFDWGGVGFILGHPQYGKLGVSTLGANLSEWTEEETVTITNYNSNGFSTILNAIDSIWEYLAYGDGTVSDNDVDLDSEISRAEVDGVNKYNTYMTQEFKIDVSTDNGETITEWGLAKTDVSEISSTDNYAPIEKNNLIYVQIIIKTMVNNI